MRMDDLPCRTRAPVHLCKVPARHHLIRLAIGHEVVRQDRNVADDLHAEFVRRDPDCVVRTVADPIVALGAVIRGGTPHFEYVAGECTKGLAQVSMEYGVPVAFGVLTVDSIEQAIERSGTKAGNKGAEAALSALEMVSLLAQLEAK